jgi:hypothetical protein
MYCRNSRISLLSASRCDSPCLAYSRAAAGATWRLLAACRALWMGGCRLDVKREGVDGNAKTDEDEDEEAVDAWLLILACEEVK